MFINGKVNFKITLGRSKIHGKGSFAGENIPAGKKIGHLGGIIISRSAARKIAKQHASISIVELWNGKALDASLSKDLRYINHSCNPNTFMRNLNNYVEFYALTNIKIGAELTCDYGPTHHDGKIKCKCGAENCKGRL